MKKKNKQKKMALSFATKRGVTFSMLTNNNIKNEQNESKNQSAIKEIKNIVIAERNEEDGYTGSN